MGDSPIIDELNTIAKIKKVGTATIQVKKINSPTEASDAQVVFIPAGKKKVVMDFAPVLKNSNTLIITDDASGGFGINFVEVDQKQSFQISKANIESHKLKVNSSLIALGIPVN